MKKFAVLMTVVLCLMLTGCSNAFAKEEYDSAEKIVKNDRYAETGWTKTTTHNVVHVQAKSFDGRETLLTTTAESDYEITAVVAMRLSKGKVKLVNIDSNGKVSTLAECSAEDGPLLTETVISRTSGSNKLKLVGYDCQDVEMQLTENSDSAVTINK